MCIILDTNTFSRFRNPEDENLEPVREWLREKNGKIAYSNTEKFQKEWKGKMDHWRNEQMRAGKFKLVPRSEVEKKESELKGRIKSDDAHIVALALVAEVKLLVSYYEIDKRNQRGDKALFKDFTNRDLVGGKVYVRKEHKHLLTEDTCP